MNKIKVKKALHGRFKNNKLTLIFGGTVATIFLLILLKAWLSREADSEVTFTESLTEIFNTNPSVDERPNSEKKYPPLTRTEVRAKKRAAYMASKGIERGALNYRIQQQRIISEFKETVHLRMKFPEGLHYVTVDLEEGVAGITGITTTKDQAFAVLATAKPVTVSDAVAFLQESASAFPMLKGHEFQPDKVQSFTPPESTGLGPMTIIPATESQGKDLFAVLAPRQDKQGNYLFMMEAETRYFDANEDGFEKMLEGMKAEP